MKKALQILWLAAMCCLSMEAHSQWGLATLTFECHDSYGDGWNNCAIQVIQGDTLRGTVTLSSGYEGTYTVDVLASPDSIYFIWVLGSWPYEVSFTIYNFDESVIVSGTGDNYSSGDTIARAVVQMPTCFKPTGLRIANIGSESLTLAWDDLRNSGATYSASCYLADSLISTITGIAGHQITFTGLEENTEYTLHVNAVCGEGDMSPSAVGIWRTLCSASMTLPYIEDWEGIEEANPWSHCWTLVHQLPNPDNTLPNLEQYTEIDGTTGKVLVLRSVADTLFVVSAPVPLPGNKIDVSFCLNLQNNWVTAGVMTNPYDPTTFIPMVYADQLGGGWTEYAFNTQELDSNTTYYVAWKSYGTSRWNTIALLDRIVIGEYTGCPRPQSTSVDSVGYYGVRLSWSVPDPNTNYVVYYGTNPNVIGTDSVVVSGATAVIAGLQPNTTYYAWIRTLCATVASPLKRFPTFTTLNSCTKINRLTLRDVGYTAASIEWDAGHQAGYPSTGILLTLTSVTDSAADPIEYYTSGDEYFIRGLAASAAYLVSAQKVCPTEGLRVDTSEAVWLTISTTTCAEISGTGDIQENYLPTYSCYGNTYSQMIYTEEEMPAIDTIRGISFNVSSPVNTTRTADIYMGHTTQNGFVSNQFIPLDSLTLVKTNATLPMNTTGWQTMILDNNFVWNGNDNLVIAFNDHTNSYVCTGSFAAHVSSVQGISVYRDNQPYIAAEQSFGNPRSYMPDIRFVTTCATPTCIPPMPAYTEVHEDNSITLSWLDFGDEGTFIPRYQLRPSTDYVMFPATTDTSYTFTGLNPSSVYMLSVGRLCDGDTLWSRPLSVHTPCNGMTIPWFDNFETDDVDDVPMCWNVVSQSYYNGNCYPAVINDSYNTDYTNALCLRGVGFSSIATGPIPLQGNKIVISFQARSYEWNSWSKVGVMTDPSDTSTFISLSEYFNYSTTTYFFYTSNLDSNATYYLAFQHYGENDNSYFYIDNLSIKEDAGCRIPFLNYFENIDSTHCSGGFYSEGNTTDFLLRYYIHGDSTQHYITITSDNTTYIHFTLSGLQSSSYYHLSAAPLCGTDTLWSSDYTFNTYAVCPQVAGITLTGATQNNLSFAWNPIADYYGQYEVYLDGNLYSTIWDTAVTINNLLDNHQYTIGVKAYCHSGMWSNIRQITASTLAIPIVTQYPYTTTFDNAGDNQDWLLINGNNNKWYIGNTANSDANNTLYISNDEGVSATYTITYTDISYAIRRLQVTEEADYLFAFDWRAYGESNYDYLRAWVAPDDIQLQARYLPNGSSSTSSYTTTTPQGWIDLGGKMNLQNSWNNNSQLTHLTTGNYRLVIMWCNDGSVGTQPPAAIDNLTIQKYTCPVVATVNTSEISQHAATLTWTDTAATTGVTYSILSGNNVIATTTDTTYTLTGLDANTTYTFGIARHCSSTDISYPIRITFTTLCDPTPLPYTCGFEADETHDDSQPMPDCWNKYNSSNGTYPYVTNHHVYEGQRSLYFYCSSSSSTDTMMAILPAVDIENYPMTNNHLVFFTNMSYTGQFQLQVGTMSDPYDPATFTADSTLILWNSGTTEHIIPLATHSPSTNRFPAFLVPQQTNSNSLYIDAVSVNVIPTCHRPEDFYATGIFADSISLAWTAENATSWEIEATSADSTLYFTASSADVTVDADNIVHFTATPLNPHTYYQFRIRANCGSGYSYWTPFPIGYTTLNNEAAFTSFEITSIEREPAVIDTAMHTITVPIYYSDNLPDEYGTYTLTSGSTLKVLDDAGIFVPVNNMHELLQYVWINIPLTVRIYAEDIQYHSDWTILLVGEACTRVNNIEVQDERTALNVTWEETDPSVSNFQLLISPTPLGSEALDAAEKVSVGQKSYRFEGLERATTYYLYFRAVCDNCLSGWTMVEARTKALQECGDILIGDTLSQTTSYHTPLNNYYNYTLTQTILFADELEDIVGIDGLSFFYDYSFPSTVKNDVSIYLQPTQKESFSSSNDMVPLDSSAVLVYSGPMNMTQGWNYFEFNSRYSYSSGNLLVIVDDNSGHYDGSAYRCRTSPTTEYTTIEWYSDGSNPDINNINNYSGSKEYYAYRVLMKVNGCTDSLPCPTVSALTLEEVGTTTATLHWEPSDADYLDHYEVFVSPTPVEDPDLWSAPFAYSGNATGCTLTGLEAYTDYYAYVRANCTGAARDEGTSAWQMLPFKTFSTCRAVADLTATLTDRNAALVTWRNQGPTGGYEYVLNTSQLSDAELATATLTEAGITDTSVMLTALAYQTTYYLYLRSNCGGSVSPWTSTSLTTLEAMPAVVNLHAVGVSHNAFTAVWESDMGRYAAETAWRVALAPEGEVPSVWSTVDTRSQVFYNLTAETQYRVYVAAYNPQSGETSDTVSTAVATLPLPGSCWTVAPGTSTNQFVPLYGLYAEQHQRIQSIYPASMLTGIVGKTLTTMTYAVSSGSSQNWSTSIWEVYLGITDEDHLSFDWADTSVLTPVYTGTLSASVQEGMTITLDQPFTYSGGNLLVQFVERVGVDYSSCHFYGVEAPGASRYAYPDNNIDLMSATGTVQHFLPQVQFCYQNESTCYSVSNAFFDNTGAYQTHAWWYPGNTETAWQVAYGGEEMTVAEAEAEAATVTSHEITLNNLAADTRYRFFVRPVCSDTTYGGWSMFSFASQPTCSLPSTLWADNITGSSATLHAQGMDYGTAQSYTFRYWTTGEDTLSVISATDSVTIGNLLGTTTYWFDVVAHCGADGDSRWTLPVSFQTSCGPVLLPYYHHFSWNNECWTFVSANPHNSILQGNYCYGNGIRFTSAYRTMGNNYDQYAYSPLLASDSSTPYKVTIEYATDGSNDRLWIGYSMTGSTDPDEYTWSTNYFTTYGECDLRQAHLFLPAGVKRVAVRYYGNHAGQAYLYNVSINEPASYTLNVNVDTNYGSVDGLTGTLYEATNVVLTAAPNHGYRFYSWTDPWDNTVSVENPYSFILTGDLSLTANFIPRKYNITSLTSNATMGSVSGGGRVNYLTPVTLTATPNYGYHFSHWSNGDSIYTTTLVADTDITLVAYFDYNQYAILGISTDTVMGTVDGSDTVNYLSTVTLTATPRYGYHFSHWSNGDTTATLTLLATEHRTLTANFDYNSYAVSGSPNNPVMGTVSGSSTVNYLTDVTLTATPNYGYHFSHWTGGDTNATITLSALCDTAVVAYFDYNRYTLTALSSDTVMGSASGSATVNYLDSVTFTATANYGYHFTHWSNGNTNATLPIQATGDLTLSANFTYNQYTVNALNATPDRGSVSGSATVNYLTPVTLNATPYYGYRFTGWTGDLPDALAMAMPLTVIADSNRNITATFDTIAYNVVATVNDTVMGTVSGADSTRHFASAHLTAIANYGYHFSHWSNSAGNVLGVSSTIDIWPVSDTALIANFAVNQYFVSGNTDNPAMGSVTGSASADYLAPVTLTAHPGTCYHFLHWSNGDTNATITISATRDTVLTAFFAANIYGSLETDTACDSYTWNGYSFTLSGLYSLDTVNNNGCDSTATLDLTVHYGAYFSETATACDSYLWRDSLYIASGNYAYHFFTSQGCDSILTLILTINHSAISHDSISTCDSYLWNDNLYIVSGTYVFDTLTAQGCDSTATLTLTLHYGQHVSDSIIACENYYWHDSLYAASGTYIFHTLTTEGCDSTETIFLTIGDSSTTYDTLVLNADDLPYEYRSGIIVDSVGDYTFFFTSMAGCDSIIMLHVSVEQTGIELPDNMAHIRVYPNPTRGIVTIADEIVIKVEIYDAVGRRVQVSQRSNTLDLTSLPSGTYILRITTSTGTAIRHLIKE